MNQTITELSRLPVTNKQIADFCQRWQITELALFGSVLRGDFRQDSDVDVLVTFAPEAHHSLFDFVRAQQELEDLFGRKVDLVEKDSITNPFRRRTILNSYQTIYAADRT